MLGAIWGVQIPSSSPKITVPFWSFWKGSCFPPFLVILPLKSHGAQTIQNSADRGASIKGSMSFSERKLESLPSWIGPSRERIIDSNMPFSLGIWEYVSFLRRLYCHLYKWILQQILAESTWFWSEISESSFCLRCIRFLLCRSLTRTVRSSGIHPDSDPWGQPKDLSANIWRELVQYSDTSARHGGFGQKKQQKSILGWSQTNTT